MSDELQAAAEELRTKLDGSGFQGSVKFDVADAGVIRVEDEKVVTEDGPADCTISAAMETFEEMFKGDLDPTSAFMTGKIRIEGDMSAAMRLAQIL